MYFCRCLVLLLLLVASCASLSSVLAVRATTPTPAAQTTACNNPDFALRRAPEFSPAQFPHEIDPENIAGADDNSPPRLIWHRYQRLLIIGDSLSVGRSRASLKSRGALKNGTSSWRLAFFEHLNTLWNVTTSNTNSNGNGRHHNHFRINAVGVDNGCRGGACPYADRFPVIHGAVWGAQPDWLLVPPRIPQKFKERVRHGTRITVLYKPAPRFVGLLDQLLSTVPDAVIIFFSNRDAKNASKSVDSIREIMVRFLRMVPSCTFLVVVPTTDSCFGPELARRVCAGSSNDGRCFVVRYPRCLFEQQQPRSESQVVAELEEATKTATPTTKVISLPSFTYDGTHFHTGGDALLGVHLARAFARVFRPLRFSAAREQEQESDLLCVFDGTVDRNYIRDDPVYADKKQSLMHALRGRLNTSVCQGEQLLRPMFAIVVARNEQQHVEALQEFCHRVVSLVRPGYCDRDAAPSAKQHTIGANNDDYASSGRLQQKFFIAVVSVETAATASSSTVAAAESEQQQLKEQRHLLTSTIPIDHACHRALRLPSNCFEISDEMRDSSLIGGNSTREQVLDAFRDFVAIPSSSSSGGGEDETAWSPEDAVFEARRYLQHSPPLSAEFRNLIWPPHSSSSSTSPVLQQHLRVRIGNYTLGQIYSIGRTAVQRSSRHNNNITLLLQRSELSMAMRCLRRMIAAPSSSLSSSSTDMESDTTLEIRAARLTEEEDQRFVDDHINELLKLRAALNITLRTTTTHAIVASDTEQNLDLYLMLMTGCLICVAVVVGCRFLKHLHVL